MGNSKSVEAKEKLLTVCIDRGDLVGLSQLLADTPELLNRPLQKASGHTPLMRAVKRGTINVFQELLRRQADLHFVSPKGDTALTLAVAQNNEEFTKELLQAGADPKAVLQSGLKVIDIAILMGNLPIAQMIFDRLEDKSLLSVEEYSNWHKKMNLRYVDYGRLMEALKGRRDENCAEAILNKPKKVWVDPVVDPRETWKQWASRQMEFKEAPLVERNSLPEELQPQNRFGGKIRNFTYNFTKMPHSVKTTLKPNRVEIQSEMVDLVPSLEFAEGIPKTEKVHHEAP